MVSFKPYRLGGPSGKGKPERGINSPQIRAQESARAISERHHLPIMLRDGLCSVNYGNWERRSEAEVAQQDPEAFRLYLEGIERFRFPRGETLDYLRQQAVAVLEEGDWCLGQDPGCINLVEWEGSAYRLQWMNWVPQESL